MKPLLSLVILIFVFGFALGQEQKKPSKKIQLGINYSPDYNYRTLIINHKTKSAIQVKDIRNMNESPKFGYTTGLQITYILQPNWSLTTGLLYSNKGYILIEKPFGVFESELLNDKHNFATHFKYTFHYIDLPICISFQIGNNRMQLVASAGVINNIYIKEYVAITHINESSPDLRIHPSLSNHNKFNLSANISCGINYHLLSKIDIRIEPTFRYQLFNTRNTDLSAHLWNIGMNTAILFSF